MSRTQRRSIYKEVAAVALAIKPQTRAIFVTEELNFILFKEFFTFNARSQ